MVSLLTFPPSSRLRRCPPRPLPASLVYDATSRQFMRPIRGRRKTRDGNGAVVSRLTLIVFTAGYLRRNSVSGFFLLIFLQT